MPPLVHVCNPKMQLIVFIIVILLNQTGGSSFSIFSPFNCIIFAAFLYLLNEVNDMVYSCSLGI